MKQKIVALIEVITELEDLVTIPNPDDTDKKDLDCALRDFIRLYTSLVLDVTKFDFTDIQKMDRRIDDLNKKIEELKNEKK